MQIPIFTLLRPWIIFDASGGRRFEEVLKGTKVKVLVISFKSDWLYPGYQSKGDSQGLQAFRGRDNLL